MILADGNYEIMTLLRSHRDDAKGLQIMARHVYPLHSIRLRQPVTAEQLTAGLDSPDASTLRGVRKVYAHALPYTQLEFESKKNRERHGAASVRCCNCAFPASNAVSATRGFRTSLACSQKSSVAGVLGSLQPYGPQISDHVALSADLQPQQNLKVCKLYRSST